MLGSCSRGHRLQLSALLGFSLFLLGCSQNQNAVPRGAAPPQTAASKIDAYANTGSVRIPKRLKAWLEKMTPMSREMRLGLQSGMFPKVIGPETDIKQLPWQIAILAGGKRCGGILITPSYVLTAAHCLDRNEAATGAVQPIPLAEIKAWRNDSRFGSGELLVFDSASPIMFHEDWRQGVMPRAADVALIRLKSPLSAAVTAPLQTREFESGFAVASGWGRWIDNAPSPMLRAASLPVIKNAKCQTETPTPVAPIHMCTAHQRDNICLGDSGGPLVVGDRQYPQTIGIVHATWTEACNSNTPGSDLKIGVFVRASAIAAWVRRTTGDPSSVTSDPPRPLNILASSPLILFRQGLEPS